MQVVVDRLESTSDLHAHLSPSTMARLQIDEDDVIKIASPARKFIIIAVSSKGFHGADNSICIGRNFRQLLECYLGETVTIEPFKFCQAATKVVLAPIVDTMNGITGNFLNVIKNSTYDFNNIPVWEDMVIPIYAMQHVFEFRVIECKPIFAVIITDPDVIQCQNESVERVKSPIFDKICYDDIGGIDSQLLTIRKLVENPRTSSALIVAPSGCGKTFLSQAIRNETKSHFEFIPAPQLLGLKYDKGKSLLSRVLEVTAQNTPAIVYIDDIDSIAGIQNYDGEKPDDRLVNSFSDFIDHLRKMPNVLILATSKSIEDLRSDFHPPTCFNEAIKIDIPTRQERSSILRAITRRMTLTSANAIEDMASMTEGQTPSHLLLICKRTILSHLNELLSNFDLNNPNVRLDDLHDIAVGQGVYSSTTASQATRNKKKKSKVKEGNKKESRINNLDPFGDLLSQQNDDDSNSDDDDNDNDNEDDYMFPVNSSNNPTPAAAPSNNRSSLNPFNQMNNSQGDMNKNDNDAMFGFGIASQKDNNLNGSTNDIFGAAPTTSNDPFALQKGTDPFSVPGNGSTTVFPMNDPFSSSGAGGSSTAAAAAAAAAMGNPYGMQSSGHHKKRDGDDGKKHKKHKKHNKNKRDDSGNSNTLQSNQPIPQNPFNTASLSNNQTASINNSNNNINSNNDDPFSQPKQSTPSADPFAAPNQSSINSDPFSQPKSSTSKASVDPFADPFSTPSPSAAQKKVMISQNSDPFASDSKKNDDQNLSAMPRNPNRINNSDPFAQPNGSKDSNASDPFAPALKRGGRSSDPFAPSSVRNKSARDSIDPFAPPNKK